MPIEFKCPLMALAAINVEKRAKRKYPREKFLRTSKFQVVFSRYLHAHNRLFERALHAVPFTLMAAKAINAHQCFALREHSSLCNGL